MNDKIILLIYEWKHISRQPAVWILFLFFYVIGGYAIYSGNVLTRNKLHAIEESRKGSAKDYRNALMAFTDTANAEKKQQAANAGDPYVIDYRYPRTAYDHPYPMAGLASGIKDLTPVTEKVNYYTDHAAVDREMINPSLLFEGRLDLVYVNLYLIPLLVIVLVYNIISSEKENGISDLLIVQGGTLKRVLLGKLLTRLIIVFLAAFILNALGMLLSSTGSPSFKDALIWFFLLLLYCVLWISICFAIISLDGKSVVNLFSCIAVWVFLMFLLPLVINKAAQIENPSNLKLVGLEEKDRHISDEVWALKPKAVVDSFYTNFPRYASAYRPSDTVDNQNDAFFGGYYLIKEHRMKAVIDSVWDEDVKANQTAYRLIRYNPVQSTEHLFTLLARTSRKDYLSYKQDVMNFRRQWQTYFYDRVFSVKDGKRSVSAFSPEELGRLPDFKMQYHEVKFRDFVSGILVLLTISVLCFAGGLLMMKKFKQ
jgi:ABC-type transport system involved in multi-copper enzyme maturation permease subunit